MSAHDGGPQRLTLTTPLAGLEPAGPVDVPALARPIEAIGLAIPGLPPKALVAVEAAAQGITPRRPRKRTFTASSPDGRPGPASRGRCGLVAPARR